jgi:hypothetical protein
MHQLEALSILGLRFTEIHDTSTILKAWKQRIRGTHPDKNHRGQENATEATQQLNEAKDTLLDIFNDPYEKKIKEDEEERVSREKEQAEREADNAELRQKCEDMYNKMKAHRRENYSTNRKKRLPTTRVHRKINDYLEGKALVEEMQMFFREKFMEKVNSTLLVGDILYYFIKSRDHTTDLEANLFKRHSKKLFLSAWPGSKYSSCKNKRCFRHVCAKK